MTNTMKKNKLKYTKIGGFLGKSAYRVEAVKTKEQEEREKKRDEEAKKSLDKICELLDEMKALIDND